MSCEREEGVRSAEAAKSSIREVRGTETADDIVGSGGEGSEAAGIEAPATALEATKGEGGISGLAGPSGRESTGGRSGHGGVNITAASGAESTVGTPSFSTPSSGTRTRVLLREGNICWLCERRGPDGLEVAHHIAAAQTQRFLYFRSIHVVPQHLTHLAHKDNLITLCPSCKKAFDCAHPYWIMLPTAETLDTYIQHERLGYQQRRRAGLRGEAQPRTPPSINKEAVRYMPCILEPTFAEDELRLQQSHWPKAWFGEPSAAIIKAALGLHQPCEPRVITRQGVLEENVRLGVADDLYEKCSTLMRLWARSAPPVVELKTTTKKRERPSAESDEDPGEGAKGKGKERERRVRTKREAAASDRKLRSATTTAPVREAGRALAAQEEGGALRLEGTDVATYAFGPDMTSNALISEVMRWRALRGVREGSSEF